MAEVQRVPLHRPPSRNWVPTIAAAFGLLVLVLIAKPWAPSGPGTTSPVTTAGNHAPGAARATEDPRERFAYDPRLFGFREPPPAWELWPAGYVVQFGMAGPLPVHGQGGASPPPPTAAATPSLAPTPSPAPTAAAETGLPGAPAQQHVVDLGPTNHLIALGINTPADVRVSEISLWIHDADGCCPEKVSIVRLPTLWESEHFKVIAPEDPEREGQAGPWQPGEYRLDLVTAMGEVREVRLRITAPLE